MDALMGSSDDNAHVYELSRIAAIQAKAGDKLRAERTFEVALRAARALSKKRYRNQAFRWIAEGLAEAGDVAGAKKMVRSISDEDDRNWVLGSIARAQATASSELSSPQQLH